MSFNSIKFEEVLEEAGSAGRWQWLYAFVAVLSYRQAFMIFPQYGEMAATGFCAQPELAAKNWTLRQQRLYSSPDTTSCTYFNLSYSEIEFNFTLAMATREADIANVSKLQCTAENGWQPETSDARYLEPTSAQFHIVCEKRWLRPLAGIFHMFGLFIGLLISGPLSDHFGRRKSVLVFGFGTLIIGPLVSLSPNYVVYIIMRTLIAVVYMPYATIQWVLLTELFGNESRVSLRIFTSTTWQCALVFFVLFAYLLQNWRYLHLSMNIFSPFIILCAWFIPESPRWLLSKGHYAESLKQIKRIAHFNGRQLSEATIEQFEHLQAGNVSLNEKAEESAPADNVPKNKPLGYLTLLRTKELRKRTLVCSYMWFTCGLCYYAFIYGNVKLPGNTYLNGLVNASVGFLIQPIMYAMLKLIGRKYCQVTTLSLVSVFSILTAILISLPQGNLKLASIVAATIGKGALDITFAVLYLYCAELFPTVVRNMAFSAGSASARVGSAFSPVIAILDSMVWSGLPVIIIGAVALLEAILVFLFLPDTSNKPLLQTIEELEQQQTSL